MRVYLVFSVGLTLLASLAGCMGQPPREGPEMVEVTGVVTLDGEPVQGAHITFSPETRGPVAFAVSDERGRYELRTFEPRDGAIPGKYAIFVSQEVIEGGMEFESQAAMEAYQQEHKEAPPAPKAVNLLPEKYAAKETSGLTAEINVAKKNRFDLALTSK